MEKQTPKTAAKEYELENKDKQVNTYDKILRENMEAALPGIISKILLLDIVRSRNIPDSIQHTKERKPDLLKKVTDRLGITYILHVEYQLTNLKSEMVHRMLEYKAMLIRKYNLPVKQFVIYIGKGKPTMQTELNEEDLTSIDRLIQHRLQHIPHLQQAGVANYGNIS